ncbi:hypothetical protein ACP8HI_04365 [Paenibacillus sp. FA6]|uniref:hypothetical protein n=1 Tax=Paenibacillus sp. FA6 TaxID=3413029 RepID=UPI003F658BD1
MAVNGYIRDHRRELQSDIWAMPPLYHRLWQYLKYKVNYEDGEIPKTDGGVFLIKKGQHLTSVRGLAQGISWYEGVQKKEPNPKTIASILEWMVKRDMITIERGKGNREYTLITLVNWGNYQPQAVTDNSEVTHDGEAREQQADIKNKELRRINKELIKKDIKDSSAEINNFRSRYFPDLIKIIDEYLDFVRETRKGKNISDSIILKIMKYFDKYTLERVEYAIRTHMGLPEKSSAKEEYTFAIVKNTTDEEANRKLTALRNGTQSNDKIGNSRFDQNKSLLQREMEELQNEQGGHAQGTYPDLHGLLNIPT